MGTRAQVCVLQQLSDPFDDNVPSEQVYFYQHMDGYNLPDTVKKALAKRWRWDDPTYLARIIFSEMVKNYIDGETGYGISASPFDVAIDITVSVPLQKVRVQGYGKDKMWTFEEFLKVPDGWVEQEEDDVSDSETNDSTGGVSAIISE